MASTSKTNATKSGLVCGLCFFESPTENAFLNHLSVKHPRDLFFWCRWCGILFSDRLKYVQHTTSPDCAKCYQFNHPCGFEKCNYSTGNPTRFLTHFSRNHRGSSFIRCFYCKRSFTIPACLVEHIQVDCCERPPRGSYNGDSDGETNEPRTQNSSGYKGPYMQAAPVKITPADSGRPKNAAVAKLLSKSGGRDSSDPDDPQPVNSFQKNKPSTTSTVPVTVYNQLRNVSNRRPRNLINYCKECGLVLPPEKEVSEHHASGQCIGRFKFIHRCGFKHCQFSTGNPQEYILHFSRAHNGEQFLACFMCHRSFSIPSCLVEHIQTQCGEPFPHATAQESTATNVPITNTPIAARKSTIGLTNSNVQETLFKRKRGRPIKDNSPKSNAANSRTTQSTPTARTVKPKRGAQANKSLADPASDNDNWGDTYNDNDSDSPAENSQSTPSTIPYGQPQTIRPATLSAVPTSGVNINQGTSVFSLIPVTLAVYGQHNQVLGQPNQILVQPNQILGQGNQILVQPNQILGQATQILGQPNQILGQPNQILGGPNQVVRPATGTIIPAVQIKQEPLDDNEEIITGDIPDFKMYSDESGSTTDNGNILSRLLQAGSEEKVLAPVPTAVHCIKSWNEWSGKYSSLKVPEALKAFLTNDKIEHFFKCMSFMCEYSSHDRLDYSLHIMMNHKDDILICCYCFASYSTMDQFLDHICKVHNELCFQCSACMYRGSSKEHVLAHSKSFHTDQTTTVITCTKLSSSAQNLDAAVEMHKTYNCSWNECSFRTLFKIDFLNHWQKQHPECTSFNCCYCSYKTNKAEILLNHCNTHNMHAYECDYCPFGSEKMALVIDHICLNHASLKFQMLNRLPSDPQKSPIRNISSPEIPDIVSSSTDSILPFSRSLTPNQGIVSSSNSSQNKGGSVTNKEAEMVVRVKEEPVSDSEDAGERPNVSNAQQTAPTSEIAYMCFHCNEISPSLSLAEDHAQKVHKMRNLYMCSACNYGSKETVLINLHLRMGHGDTAAHSVNLAFSAVPATTSNVNKKPAESSETDTSQPQEKSTVLHTYSCVFCNYSTSEKNHMVTHLYMEIHYFKYTCNFCNFKGRFIMDIVDHCKKSHGRNTHDFGIKGDEMLEKWVEDYVTAQKQQSDGENVLGPCLLDNHLKKNTCNMCKVKFETQKYLQEHMYSHLQYRPHHCRSCDKRFISLSAVEVHQLHDHKSEPKGSHYHGIKIIEDWVSNVIAQNELFSGRTTGDSNDKFTLQANKSNAMVSILKSIDATDKRREHSYASSKSDESVGQATPGVELSKAARSLEANVQGQLTNTSNENVSKRTHDSGNDENSSPKKMKLSEMNMADKELPVRVKEEPVSPEPDNQETFSFSRETATASLATSSASGLSSLDLISQLSKTARKSTTNYSQMMKTYERISSKSASGTQNMPKSDVEKYSSRYGCQPEEIDLSKIYVVTKPYGSDAYIHLNVFYLKDLFKRTLKVKVKDCQKSALGD